jgi:peptide deformylase
MADLLPLVIYPDPFLRRKVQPIETVTDDVRTQIASMIRTMIDARGIGLAATQVGWNARVAIVSSHGTEEDTVALINPEIIEIWGSHAAEEGCLSFPGVHAVITRPRGVLVRFTGLDGEEYEIEDEELLGRCIQHELDHLDGITFLSKMTPADKLANRGALKALNERAALRKPA